MILGGYNPAQVRAAIDARDKRLLLLEREAQQLAHRVIYTEQRLQAALEERNERVLLLEREAQRLAQRVIDTERRLQAALRGQAGDQVPATAIGGLSRRLEEIHAQARRQATRIRMAALEDAVQISDRVSELSRLRDELGARVAELAGLAGIRIGAEEEHAAVGAEPARETAHGVFSGAVDVEVGPLRDFAQLSGFEDAVAGIDGEPEVAVKAFSDRRATFSMNFAQPVELLRELERRAPFAFSVRAAAEDSVVLDVEDGEAPRAA